MVNESVAFYRIVIGVLTSLVVMILTLVVGPYKHTDDQAIAVSSQVLLVIVFVGSGYIKAFKDTEAEAAKLGQVGIFANKIY